MTKQLDLLELERLMSEAFGVTNGRALNLTPANTRALIAGYQALPALLERARERDGLRTVLIRLHTYLPRFLGPSKDWPLDLQDALDDIDEALKAKP